MAGYQPGRISAMPTVAELLHALDTIAPPQLAYPNDPIGLQVGRKSDVFEKAVVTLDVSPAAIDYAVSVGAAAIVSHHALIYHPLRSLAGDGFQAQAIRAALRANLAVLTAHTNWDAAPGGVNDTLADALGLQGLAPFGNDIETDVYKLSVFVPAADAQGLIDSLAEAGAGGLGYYRRCAFFSPGTGTFEPQPGASPAIGEVGSRSEVDEVRIEMRLDGDLKPAVEAALLAAHPYEEPAYDFWKVSSDPVSLGRTGTLPGAMRFGDLREYVDHAIGSRCSLFGKMDRKVSRIGVVGGAGGDYWLKARRAGCDALVTGECRHHEAVEAAESGFGVIAAGHFHTEQPGVVALAERLRQVVGGDFLVFSPEVGRSGRPDA